MNAVLVDKQHPNEWGWISLSKAQLTQLSLAAPVDAVLSFNNSHVEITGGALPEDIWGINLSSERLADYRRPDGVSDCLRRPERSRPRF